MRTICDVCESAPAILFCAADEAALCRSCDEKVHMCNKLASRHLRVGLADPSAVTQCDICENAPAFFYCEVDGSSLCLQCDMIVHVGGKRKHRRYLMLRQRIEFPGDKSGSYEELGLQPSESNREPNNLSRFAPDENQQNHRTSQLPILLNKNDGGCRMDSKMIDLNTKPHRLMQEQGSNNQENGIDMVNGNNHESASVVPVGYHQRERESGK